MVTYGLRLTKLQVRVLAPHPLILFLSILLLSGSAMAADLQVSSSDFDHYAAAPGSLAGSILSSDSLARAGGLFGVNWYYSPMFNAVTQIDGVSMQGRADGVQDLANVTYRTFRGVEEAITDSFSDQSNWLQLIYNTLQQSGDMGTVYTRLLELISTVNARVGSPAIFYGQNAAGFVPLERDSLLGGLLSINDQLFLGLYMGHRFGNSYLNTLGQAVPGSNIGLSDITASGFTGLGHLLFGDSSHTIYGLGYTGFDSEGQRGSWSLADISANGFSGLATLISGPSAHRASYSWLNQDGYEGTGSTSLMDMVGGGFLGLSSLLTDAERGETRLSWMYVSPDDGVSGFQSNHNTLFSFLGSVASGIQNPLARLAYVLADLEDIEFKKEEKPNMDAVKDHFFGDGEGAVNPDQIKDVAGISSGIKDSFGGAGSAGDAFQAINDSNSFWFFSQEVADALDTVNSPATAALDDSDPFEGLVQDENGFYSLIDLSPWDVQAYLGG